MMCSPLDSDLHAILIQNQISIQNQNITGRLEKWF